jgi:hypothetical protein
MTNELKSKVFQMGNKLSRDMPRREAFVEAWKIVKSDGLEVAVRGAIARASSWEKPHVTILVISGNWAIYSSPSFSIVPYPI